MKRKISNMILALFVLTAIFAASVGAAGKITVKEIASGLEYDGIGDFHDGLAMVATGKKTGYIDKTGKLVVPLIYDQADYYKYSPAFDGGLACVKIDGKENYIDKTGEVIIKIEYDEVGPFSDGMAWIKKGDKYGYIDKSGALAIPFVFYVYTDDFSGEAIVPDFSEGLAAVRIDGKCGFMDKTGKIVIPAQYSGDFYYGEWGSYNPKFHDGLVRVIKDYSPGIIDKAGEVVVPFGQYTLIGNNLTGFFTDGLAKVYTRDENGDTKSGFIDTSGNIIVPPKYSYFSDFNGALAYVHDYGQGDRGAYMDKTGTVVTPFDYYADQWCNWFYTPSCEGMTIAQKDGKFGCLDEKGNIAVPFAYDNIGMFSCGLAFVEDRESGVCGFVDKTGKMIVPVEHYPNVAYVDYKFSYGLLWVMEGGIEGKRGYVDTAGEIVVPCIYDYAASFSEGLAAVQKDGKWSILEIQTAAEPSEAPRVGDRFYIVPLLGVCAAAAFAWVNKKMGKKVSGIL